MEEIRKRLYSRMDLTEALSVSLRTVDNLLKNGELHSLRVGKRRLVRAADVEKFLKRDHATEAEAAAG